MIKIGSSSSSSSLGEKGKASRPSIRPSIHPFILLSLLPSCFPSIPPSFLLSFHPSFLPAFLPSIHVKIKHRWALETVRKGKPPAPASRDKCLASTQDLHRNITKEVRGTILPQPLGGVRPSEKNFPTLRSSSTELSLTPLHTERRVLPSTRTIEGKCGSFPRK